MDTLSYRERAEKFSLLPYSAPPYSSRSWGNAMHSLCSYQGKLKPAIAHFLVEYFTAKGETVLDPFSGSGTIPLEARLQNRLALANDLQELAFILSMAKVSTLDESLVVRSANEFVAFCKDTMPNQSEIDSAFSFGLNGSVSEYFHEDNLREILNARRYISEKIYDLRAEDAVVFSCFLHILHGNRPYALSRTSHPVTPLKPKGDFEYRDLATRLFAKLERMTGASQLPFDASSEPPLQGQAFWSNYETLDLNENVDAVITSPPFADSTRFHSSNWLRLWASGWDPDDFKIRRRDFLEEQQKQGLHVYQAFFDAAAKWLRTDGRLIMHLGKTTKTDMRAELADIAQPLFDVVYGFDESVIGSEKFGIRDQGATKYHQFLFLKKRS